MPAGAHVLVDLVIVLGVAALVALIFQKLRQPVAMGYLVAGTIIGPHVPIPLVANATLVATLSELGVILVMFSIGLELSLRKIARVGAPAALTAVTEVSLMVALGYGAGQIFGWTARESLFAGACLGISSTMLVVRAFAEQRIADAFTEVVFAILVFEDMAAILLLAVLAAVASGAGLAPSEFIMLAGKLAGFLAAILVGGLLVVPWLMRLIVRLERPETLLIAALAVCFGTSLAAVEAGYSVALGAFLAGMLVAESGAGEQVEHLIAPFRDVFGAIFFVSVGMTIDPSLLAANWLPIVVLSLLVVFGKVLGVSLGAFFAGNGLRRSVRAGMSLAQIGEFSFIIAGLGVETGAARPFLLPVAAGVSCVTALATPWLIRGSDRAARWLDARLPRGLQNFVAFYGSWMQKIRAAPARARSPLRRPLMWLGLDAALLVGTLIGAALARPRLLAFAGERWNVDETVAGVVLVAAAALLAIVFFLGVLRRSEKLARILVESAMPATDGLDLRNAPRKALVFTLELAIVLVVGVPVVALTQPFVPGGIIVVVASVLAIGFVVLRSITNLEGHVRAGAEVLVEALSRQRAPTERPRVDDISDLGIPGLSTIIVPAGGAAAGRSLRDLDVRALTGATVLAIHRAGAERVILTAQEVLRPGDVLAVAGSDDAVAAARALLEDR